MRDWRRPIAFIATLAVGSLLLYGLYWWYEERVEVYPGDEVYEGKCQACGGRGSVEPPLACEACKGKGSGKFVRPGPNHPRRLRFFVYDPDGPRTDAQARRMKMQAKFEYTFGGAVPDARVTLRSDRGTVETETDEAGEARVSLLPAAWIATIQAEGYPPVEFHVDVDVRSPKVHYMPLTVGLRR